MRSGKWLTITLLIAVIVTLITALLTVTRWLPHLVGIWLPPQTRIVLKGRLAWEQSGLTLTGLSYRHQHCELASVDKLHIGRQKQRWRISAEQVRVNTACFRPLPPTKNTASRTLAQWQAMLPPSDILIGKLIVSPYVNWSGTLTLKLDRSEQRLLYDGPLLQLDALLQGQQLTLRRLGFTAPFGSENITLVGALTLPESLAGLPEGGDLHSRLVISQLPQPVTVSLRWRQRQGVLRVVADRQPQPLLQLPWQMTSSQLTFNKGLWRWPFAAQPLSGTLSLTLTNWQQGLAETRITGRLSLLTRGRGGKGNAVLSIGPGKLDSVNSQLPFRLTGESKFAQLQLYTRMPGLLYGPLTDPSVLFDPGALLRMHGKLLSLMEIDEARWPLAGVRISRSGVSGRLQAILRAHQPESGRFRIQLDGQAKAFWPDKGLWRWRYWGSGTLLPLNTTLRLRGTGRWQDKTILLKTLSLTAPQTDAGIVIQQPRLTLKTPLYWQRDEKNPAFGGTLQLTSAQSPIGNGGYLPASRLIVSLKGTTPMHFNWRGSEQAQRIGPLRLFGRWDGKRLRGTVLWPTQSLRVMQPLLPPQMNMQIRRGDVRGQMAFSIAPIQGFLAGGHWVVSNGHLWLPDNHIKGVTFSLPFRLSAGRWHFGTYGPVSLAIKTIDNQFPLHNIHASLRGYYPWSETHPLMLSDMRVQLLGGSVSMPYLRFPQHTGARLQLRHIGLSELTTALRLKQIALSGRLNGELPLWLDNAGGWIKEGWVANDGSLTLRLDNDLADKLQRNNLAAGAALNWLRYMEISDARAQLNLDRQGLFTLLASVNGHSLYGKKRQYIRLNYRHRENLFSLWRSLRFGDNVQAWLEENITLPPTQGNQP